MKSKLKPVVEYLVGCLIIAAVMYGIFAVYADAVGHPLKIWCL